MDGGASFTNIPINSSSPSLLLLSAAAAKTKSAVVTGILAEHYTNDGVEFKNSLGPGIIAGPSQCSKPFRDSETKLIPKYGIAGTFGKDNGVATSSDGGFSFADHKTIPVDADAFPARYASFPTETTWYVALGAFPEAPAPPPSRSPLQDGYTETVAHRLSNMVDIIETTELATGKKTRAPRLRFPASFYTSKSNQPTASQPAPAPTGNFAAALAKTTDAGDTWTVQFNDTGKFYFNDISCFDADHCVAVGESGDGSTEMGNRIYATSDGGSSWKLTHFNGGAQYGCMGVRMTSVSDVTAACTEEISQFKVNAQFLTSTDGGFSWTVASVSGGSPTDLDMSSSTAGFATMVTPEQNSAIALLTSVAPTMPPTPPPYPPRPGQTHYGNPFDGRCESDEQNITITGVPGAVCSPLCTGLLKTKCSDDLPSGVTATPNCAISDSATGIKLCALMCQPKAGQCGNYTKAEILAGTGAVCHSIQGEGICTYGKAAAALARYAMVEDRVMTASLAL
jgi:hypothetical protein